MALLGLDKQKLAYLHLCLYSRPVHPELFQIYAAEQYRGPAYEMSAWIVGSAHVVSFRTADSTLTELLTSDDAPLGRRRLVGRWQLRGERTCRQTVDGRIGYMSSFQLETLSDNLYRHTYRDLVGEGRRCGMFVQFEQWKVRGLLPFAYVHCELLARELRVLAFHGFPEDRALVKTQSIFELA